MRRRYAIYFSPVVLCFFMALFSDAFAEERGVSGRSYRGSSSYQERYGTMTAGINRDIMSGRGYEYYRSQRDSSKFKKISPTRKKAASVKEKSKSTSKRISCSSHNWYIVKRGDTLYGIARRERVPVSTITSLNRLKKNKIFVGMKLKVPGRKCTADKKKPLSKKKTSIVRNKSGKLRFRWPLNNVKKCVRDGGSNVKPIGVIIKTGSGALVRAAESGVVRRVGYMRGFGKYIVIEHRNDYMTVYSNMGAVHVSEGQDISRGGAIGKVTSSRTIHFQIDRNGKARNPLSLLPSRG